MYRWTVHGEVAAIVERLAYLALLKRAALHLYAATGGADERVRCSAVAEDVATALKLTDSPWFRRDLATVLKRAGWRRVNHSQVTMWVGVRRRQGRAT